MRCDYAFDDAGYVLGALPPDERQRYVAHMAECAECRRSVRDLAGLPGLLARVEPADVAGVGGPIETAPRTLLPRLMSTVALERARARRRRAYTLTLAACLVIIAMAAVPFSLTTLRNRPAAPVQVGPSISTVAMHPVSAPGPVQATVGVADTHWGSAITLKCSYDRSAYSTEQSYGLYAVLRTGQDESLGSWSVAPGEHIETTAATRHHRADLRALEIRRADGTPVLRAAL
jgi:anti-sigma-K factor RskA